MNCPKCNTEIEEGALFCGECGTKIEYGRRCSKCGADIKQGAMFCPECGTAAEDLNAGSQENAVKDIPETSTNSSHIADNHAEVSKEPSAPAASEITINSKEDIEEELEKTMTIPIIRNIPPKAAPVPNAVQPPRTNGLTMPQPMNSSPVMATPVVNAPVMNAPVMPAPVTSHPVTNAPHMQAVSDPNYGRRQPSAPVNPPIAYVKREAPVQPASKPIEKKKDSGQTQKNILIFLLVFLLVILIGLGCIFAVMNFGGNDSSDNKADTSQSDSKNNQSTDTEKNEETKKEEDKEENKEDEKTKDVEEKKYSLTIDTDYEFAEDEELDEETYGVDSIELTTDKKESFKLEYGIPELFSLNTNTNSKKNYVETRNTAYMNVVFLKNNDEFSLDDVLEGTVGAFDDGTVFDSSSDNKKFYIKVKDNGLVYIQRCYVTEDYIRYFEFVYPEKYSEIYDDYFDVLDNAFICG